MSEYFPIHKGALLASSYEVQDFLGEGCFGKVAKCVDVVTNTKVAIKITKGNPFFTERAMEEIKILERLQILDPDECNLVKWNGSFLHEGLICLNFELLDLSLYEYMEQTCYALSIDEIRPVLHQLTTALCHLEALEIMHTDLKPDNIMVVERRQQPLQVKLIDFGLACYASNVVSGSCVQSLCYRAPEVTLGQNFSEPIDMWSLGLVGAELALGCPLFPGHHEYDQMMFIVDLLGQPPDYLMRCGQRSTCFFHVQGSGDQQTWRLKSPKEFARQTGHLFRDNRHFRHSSLDVLEEMIPFRNKAEKKALQNFVDLLKKMLLVDKNGRITPHKALEHLFFSVEQHTDSSQNMNIKTLTVDKEEDEPDITEPPSSQLMDIHCFELCNVPFKAMTPDEETLSTQPGNVSVKLEDEEGDAAHIQSDDQNNSLLPCGCSEVVMEASSKAAGCVKTIFKRTRKAFSTWFHSDDQMS